MFTSIISITVLGLLFALSVLLLMRHGKAGKEREEKGFPFSRWRD